jgi:hypothetical protein
MTQQNSAQNPCERPTSRGRLGSHCSRAGVPERCRASGQLGKPTELFGRRTCAGASSLLSRTVGELAPRDGQTEKVPFSGSRFRLRSASLVPRKAEGKRCFQFPAHGPRPHRRDRHHKKTKRSDTSQRGGTRQPGVSLLAILGPNVRHDLDIEPATRSVSSLPGNVCLTRSDGLLTGYKVACQFESHPLATQSSMSEILCGVCRKSAHIGLICISGGTRDRRVRDTP